jgi:molybdopterin molybdotransferase
VGQLIDDRASGCDYLMNARDRASTEYRRNAIAPFLGHLVQYPLPRHPPESIASMLSVEDARRVILEHSTPLLAESVPLGASALGRVLAETIMADIDMPPLDRSIMDGYAVRWADCREGNASLLVVEEITAGHLPTRAISSGEASRIMTGAPIPEGADAVVVVEKTRRIPPDRVAILDTPEPGRHILRRGQEMRRGDVLLSPGAVLRPQEIGILATAGRAAVSVIPPARVAVLATGDELVESSAVPDPGQIRNSNAPMLLAQASRAGGLPLNLGIGRDHLESLLPLIEEGLRGSHVLILSGGVSEGTRDLVPQALAAAGVVAHFHKVRLKPGKPLLFGTADRREGRRLVFGLPGNPVSSFVCFELFIRPALRRLGGFADLDLPEVSATFARETTFQNARPTYHPARLRRTLDGWDVEPVEWFGSADLRAFLKADALLRLPPGEVRYLAGHRVDVLRLDG